MASGANDLSCGELFREFPPVCSTVCSKLCSTWLKVALAVSLLIVVTMMVIYFLPNMPYGVQIGCQIAAALSPPVAIMIACYMSQRCSRNSAAQTSTSESSDHSSIVQPNHGLGDADSSLLPPTQNAHTTFQEAVHGMEVAQLFDGIPVEDFQYIGTQEGILENGDGLLQDLRYLRAMCDMYNSPFLVGQEGALASWFFLARVRCAWSSYQQFDGFLKIAPGGIAGGTLVK
jgi:hypothetical protein